jgi:Tol biopolymer transport system component
MSWSPTGKQIAFIGTLNQADFNGIQTINIVNVDGSGAYKLPGSPGFLSSVDWSPDGNKFLYTSGAVISVINADGTGITQLSTVEMTNDGPTTDSEPHWSPDGTRIIFTRSTTNSNSIYTMNADGTNAAKLFNFGGRQADWSADGLSAVFDQVNEIFTAKLDGSDF